MFQDYRDLLFAFHAQGVKYLVVGGYAVIFHAQPRFTKDLDLWVKPDVTNAKAVFAALARFGAPLQGIVAEDFADRQCFFRFGNEPHGFDIMPQISGLDFDEAWARLVEVVLDETTGLKANFISADDLVTAKIASGRLQDLADAEAVQKAQRLRLGMEKA